MKELKFFDRYQLIIAIIGVGAFLTAMIIFVPMFLTSTVQYDEEGVVKTIVYNQYLQVPYSVFMLTHFGALVWFAIRALTFKKRKKEYDLNN